MRIVKWKAIFMSFSLGIETLSDRFRNIFWMSIDKRKDVILTNLKH